MKKLIKNYVAKLQENEKKGFSLVELIIVMAIMAILVGIVASQVLPYMEKSRQSKDQQVLSSLCTDIESALAQSGKAIAATAASDATLANLGSILNTETVSELCTLRSASSISDIVSSCEAQLGSKLMSGGSISVTVDPGTGKIAVWVAAQDNKGGTTLSAIKSANGKNYVETE